MLCIPPTLLAIFSPISPLDGVWRLVRVWSRAIFPTTFWVRKIHQVQQQLLSKVTMSATRSFVLSCNRTTWSHLSPVFSWTVWFIRCNWAKIPPTTYYVRSIFSESVSRGRTKRKYFCANMWLYSVWYRTRYRQALPMYRALFSDSPIALSAVAPLSCTKQMLSAVSTSIKYTP